MAALDELRASHVAVTRPESLFLEVAQSVYVGYLDRLKARGKDDFDGLLWRAAALAEGGTTRFVRDRQREHGDLSRLRFVLVDEFQDFSGMFAALVNGIRAASPSVEFFCVGDDWQAINGFAGADLRYFTEFETYFQETQSRSLTINYRSAGAIVNAGNAAMHGLGTPATARSGAPPGTVWLCPLDTFRPSGFERELHEHDEITPAVLRLVRRFLNDHSDVVLLSRRNSVSGYIRYRQPRAGSIEGLGRFLTHIRSFLPQVDRDRVTISTTHKYKGLEKPAVVILDAVAGSYPLVHPAWVFLRVFGDSLKSLEAEERRLFYVALTRARDSVAIITETQRISPFLEDVRRRAKLVALPWSSLPAVAAPDEARIEVRAHESFRARDRLKELGYQFEGAGRYWYRTFQASEFSLPDLLEQTWAGLCGEISVYDASGKMIETVWPNRSQRSPTDDVGPTDA